MGRKKVGDSKDSRIMRNSQNGYIIEFNQVEEETSVE